MPPRLPFIARWEIAARNSWFKSRAEMQARLLDSSFTVALTQVEGAEDNADASYIRLSAADASFAIKMQDTLLGGFIGLLKPPAAQGDPAVILLLLEHIFSKAIVSLERKAGSYIAIESIGRDNPLIGSQYVRLNAEIRGQGYVFPVSFYFTPESASIFIPHLNNYFHPRRQIFDVPISTAFQLGTTRLTLENFKTIMLNDIILIDRSAGPGMVLALAGRRYGAKASYDSCGTATLAESFRRRNDDFGENAKMSIGGITDGTVADATLDDIEIPIVFELGRTDLRLEQLGVLGAGHVFDLGKDARTAVDIYAGGKRIGLGEVVQINETIGVRITRLFGNE